MSWAANTSLILPSERSRWSGLVGWWQDCWPHEGGWRGTQDPRDGYWAHLRSYHWGLLHCRCWTCWLDSRILTCSNASPCPTSLRKPAVTMSWEPVGERWRGSHLAAWGTLVSAPVYVPVVLQTAGVLEQLPALVTRISASSSPAGVESLAHAIWNINNYNQPPPPLFYAWQNTNNQLKWETLESTFTPTCFKLLIFIKSLNTASLATS